MFNNSQQTQNLTVQTMVYFKYYLLYLINELFLILLKNLISSIYEYIELRVLIKHHHIGKV